MCAEIMQAMLELDRNMHTSDVLQAPADWADDENTRFLTDRNLGDRRVTALSMPVAMYSCSTTGLDPIESR